LIEFLSGPDSVIIGFPETPAEPRYDSSLLAYCIAGFRAVAPVFSLFVMLFYLCEFKPLSTVKEIVNDIE